MLGANYLLCVFRVGFQLATRLGKDSSIMVSWATRLDKNNSVTVSSTMYARPNVG